MKGGSECTISPPAGTPTPSNAPGKFLIAAAEHDTPKRARAYLLTDQVVEAAATYYADHRPPLDPISQQAAGEDQSERMSIPPDPDTMTPEHVQDGPDVILWAALVTAPPAGVTVPAKANPDNPRR